jgi:lysophospholipase L1-like esterase
MQLSTGRKALFGAATAAALFGLTEAGLRAAASPVQPKAESPVDFVGNDAHGRFPTAFDPDCFWRIPANAAIPDLTPPESVNSHGFRGPDFETKKPAGARRIVLLGDSNTFGMSVEGDENYAHMVRRWLGTRKDVKWDVVNCAIPGYSALQMQQMFRTVAKAFSPDIVCVYAGAWNDFTPAMGLDDIRALAAMQRERARREGLSFERLRVYGRFREWFARPEAPKEANKKKIYQDLWEKGERPDGPRLSEAQFRGVLTSLCREIHDAGGKALLIVPPAPAATRARWKDSDRYADIVREVAKASADLCLDARADLTFDETFDIQLFRDIIHPSHTGHTVIASRLTQVLTQARLEGLPERAFDVTQDPPIRLKSYQGSAVHEIGDPLTPIDTNLAATVDLESIVLPGPHRVTFRDVPISMQASLLLELGFYTRRDFTAEELATPPREPRTIGPLTFEVRVARAGEEPKLVFRQERVSDNSTLWSPVTRPRVDLSEYSGEKVSIVLECKGPVVVRAFWGTCPIFPCR